MLKAYISRAQPRYREGQIVYLCDDPKSHLPAACERFKASENPSRHLFNIYNFHGRLR